MEMWCDPEPYAVFTLELAGALTSSKRLMAHPWCPALYPTIQFSKGVPNHMYISTNIKLTFSTLKTNQLQLQRHHPITQR